MDPMPNAGNFLSGLPVDGLPTDAEIDDWVDAFEAKRDDWLALRERQVDALFAHFGVTKGDWQALAMALADEHIPGFREQPPAGRPNDWPPGLYLKLVAEIAELIRNDRSLSQERALEAVLKKRPWRLFKLDAETLGRRLRNFLKNDLGTTLGSLLDPTATTKRRR